MSHEDWRRFYADEIRWCASVKTPGLVDAFARVPREQFLGPAPWLLASPEVSWSATASGSRYTETSEVRDLYHNLLVALDASRNVNNGQPSALARWMDALELKSGERVFHLGCGVGYYTAIMAEVVGSGGRVVASEVDADLAARAQGNLAGYTQVVLHAMDGAEVDAGECDAVLINAGVTHPHSRWLDRLSEGGRMVLPLTAVIPQAPELGRGAMMKLVRKGASFPVEMVTYVGIYSCTSARDAEMNSAIGPALSTGALGKVKSLRRDAHEKAESCVVHGSQACWSSVPV